MHSPKLSPYWSSAMTYAAYIELVADLVANKQTTGPNQGEDMVHYTRLNASRMKRLNKTVRLSEEMLSLISGLQKSQQWLVITESWCGDAAQVIPLLGAIETSSEGKIEMRLILRDENLELMDQYLTRGGRSIPKLIAVDAHSGEELGSWGPRPDEAQVLVDAYKSNPDGRTFAQFASDLQQWYNKDKGVSIEKELREAISNWDQ